MIFAQDERRSKVPKNIDPPPGRLMDNRQIREELGVSESQADRIIRWCNEHGHGVVRPVDGAKKLYAFRDDVQTWIEKSTRGPGSPRV